MRLPNIFTKKYHRSIIKSGEVSCNRHWVAAKDYKNVYYFSLFESVASISSVFISVVVSTFLVLRKSKRLRN